MDSHQSRTIVTIVSLGAFAALVVLFLSWSQDKIASGPRIVIGAVVLIAFFAMFFYLFSWVSRAKGRR